MIQDSTNQYIATILSLYDLRGKDVLEIGCGKGRITRDLVKHAGHVIASDPDAEALQAARTAINASNAEFLEAPSGMPDLPAGSFDVVIYTLSLHHVPIAKMNDSLNEAAALLKRDGIIMVLEPGERGSFHFAKEHFGAGSGDERREKEAAIRAMHALEGWRAEETILFYTQFQFDDDEDFWGNMLPGDIQRPETFVREVRAYLDLHRAANGIVLDAERRLNVLRRK